MNTEQAALELGTSAHAVRKMIERNQLPAKKIGRDWIIRRGDLDKVRNRRRGRPPKK